MEIRRTYGIAIIIQTRIIRRKTDRKMLTDWCSGNTGASSQAHLYCQALSLPRAADVAIDQLRWTYLAQQRPSGRAYLRESAHGIQVPVLSVGGTLDPLLPARAWDNDREFALGDYRHVSVTQAGHFVPEEAPEQTTHLILEFLAQLRVD